MEILNNFFGILRFHKYGIVYKCNCHIWGLITPKDAEAWMS
jgi:hypothetical protein